VDAGAGAKAERDGDGDGEGGEMEDLFEDDDDELALGRYWSILCERGARVERLCLGDMVRFLFLVLCHLAEISLYYET